MLRSTDCSDWPRNISSQYNTSPKHSFSSVGVTFTSRPCPCTHWGWNNCGSGELGVLLQIHSHHGLCDYCLTDTLTVNYHRIHRACQITLQASLKKKESTTHRIKLLTLLTRPDRHSMGDVTQGSGPTSQSYNGSFIEITRDTCHGARRVDIRSVSFILLSTRLSSRIEIALFMKQWVHSLTK